MGERKKHLTLFGLETINSLSNILCLCSNCHEKFDAPYLIGIHPREHQLVVSPRMGSDDVTQGGIPFRSLHGNVLSFNGSRNFSPSVELLEYRFSFFKNSTNWEEKVGDGEKKGSAIYKSQEKKRTFSSFGQIPSITKWFKRCPAFEPLSSNARCKLCGLLLEKHWLYYCYYIKKFSRCSINRGSRWTLKFWELLWIDFKFDSFFRA